MQTVLRKLRDVRGWFSQQLSVREANWRGCSAVVVSMISKGVLDLHLAGQSGDMGEAADLLARRFQFVGFGDL
jgi:hypothetical protein